MLALTAAAGAVATAQSDEPAWRLQTLYVSGHAVRGVERAHASAQTSLDFALNDFRATAWVNQPFSGASNEARELNLSIAYTLATTPLLTIDVSATHGWLARVPGGGVSRSGELAIAATFAAMGGFIPRVAAHRDFEFDAHTAELAFARSIPLKKLGTFLELNFFGGWSAGENWRPAAPSPKRADGFGYWGAEATVPYQVGRYGLIAGVYYSDTSGRSLTNGPASTGSGANFGLKLGVSLDF